jgi:membrane protein implicated in regulation of membrane protease activity
MMVDEVVVARAPPADWERAEREARHAAAFVAAFVGVPAVVAAGAALLIFALTSLVLLAPLVAVVLTWAVWRYGRPDPPPEQAR